MHFLRFSNHICYHVPISYTPHYDFILQLNMESYEKRYTFFPIEHSRNEEFSGQLLY